MGKEHFTAKPKKVYSKPKQTPLLVFDIETVPYKEEDYSETQHEFVEKRLRTALLRNSSLDPVAEKSKIRGTDPYLSRIVCIGLYYPQTGQRLALTNESERVILTSFWEQLKGYSGLFISYNGIRFDIPFIIKRSIYHGISPSNMSFLAYTKYNPNPPHFDVMLQLCGRETPYALKEACDFFGVPSPKEGAVSAATVAEAYYSGRIQEIAEYCLRDLESTYKLYQKIRLYILN